MKQLAQQKESLIEEGHLFVSTVGRDEEVIRNYIRHQEAEDRRIDQLNLIQEGPLQGAQVTAKRLRYAALSGSHSSEAPGFAGGAVTGVLLKLLLHSAGSAESAFAITHAASVEGR